MYCGSPTYLVRLKKEVAWPLSRGFVRHANMKLVAVNLLAIAGLAISDAVNDLETKGRTQINDYIAGSSKTCTKDKLMVRREWYATKCPRYQVAQLTK